MILLMLVSPSSMLYGQNIGSNTGSFNNIYNRNDSQQDYEDQIKALDPNQTTDTLSRKKEAKPKKPLESYFFSDSLKKNNVFSWNYKYGYNEINVIPVDTAINMFHRDSPFLHNERVGATYLGNLGAGAQSLEYEKQLSQTAAFSFLNIQNSYLYTPENIPFYNGKRPFTQLTYFMSGQLQKLEQQLRVTHAQNISPSTGINLTYRNSGTKGMYANQRTTQKNLSLALSHTGKRYSIHGGYIYNMGDIQENGGLVDDAEVTDTIIDLSENLTMQLGDARNRFKNNTIYFTQSYAIPLSQIDTTEGATTADMTSFYVGQSFNYSTVNKIYSDSKDESGDYYDNWFIDNTATRDSIAERRVDIRGFIQLQPYSRDGLLGLVTAGAGYLSEHFYHFTPSEFISPSSGVTENSIFLYGDISGSLSRYLNWGADVNFTPVGYRSGDLKLNAELGLSAYIKERPINLDFNFLLSNQRPSYWSEHYFSNHYQWNNSFSKETETRIGATLTIPDYGIELGASQSIVTNKVYYNENSLPTQEGDAVSITGIYLQKDFRAGGFHFNHRAKLQWSSNQSVVPLPLLSANALYYYEFNVVKDVLRMQVGIDGYYNSEYYGLGYNPAISQFYNQREVQTGNYPMIDGYVSGKWKRVRILVKIQHLNYELIGGRNYFNVAHYPMNRRMLRLGLSWNFYD